jgi:23S rRNA (uracil1939-C5)-methyltransferase
VARHEGFVVFVRGALPGDRVRATVVRRKPRYAEAHLEEIVDPSPLRRAPECRHVDDCGGCEWQALDYTAQCELKQSQVVESLEHIGHLRDVAVEPIVSMPFPWGYRNKMEYSFGEDATGRLMLGLHRRGSWQEIVEVDQCRLAPVEIETARAAVVRVCRALGLRAHRRETGAGGPLRHLVVRRGLASGDLLLNLFVCRRMPEEQDLLERLRTACQFTSLGLTVNEAPADAAVGVGPFMLQGPPYLRETLADVKLHVPALAFLQTDTVMCDRLYETALRLAAPRMDRHAFDLYCGIGSLSLPLAGRAATVTGIEAQDEAVDAARDNARRNGIENVAFQSGDVRVALKWMLPLPAERRPAVVLTDPPRAGMSKKAVMRMAALGADRIVYVSCNPATLAGNAAQLTELGYTLRRVAPVDMFPHTHHVETVALFERT